MTEAFVTWEPLPAFKKGYLRCARCNEKMKLQPISQDVPEEYWECRCRKISFHERDKVFSAVAADLKKELKLKELYWRRDESYNGISYLPHYEIVSDVWEGTSRLGARRKVITSAMREEILNLLQDDLEEALQISFGKPEDYFIE
jgi:hypothetical protein